MSAHAVCADEAKTVLRLRVGGDLTKRGRHLKLLHRFGQTAKVSAYK